MRHIDIRSEKGAQNQTLGLEAKKCMLRMCVCVSVVLCCLALCCVVLCRVMCVCVFVCVGPLC